METIDSMVFYGANGHASVVIEAWVSAGGKVAAVFDDNLEIKSILQYTVMGKYDPEKFPNHPVVLSIGSNVIRKKLSTLVRQSFGIVRHPFVQISPSVQIQEGTVVMAGVVVNSKTKIGRHVILNTSCSLDHDCVIADYVHISPSATLCGGVSVAEGAHVGAGATVIQNISIGKWTIIGAGSVVIEDVPDYAVVAGTPAKLIRYNK
jgi:sugar O-acyltransferase (sialic acid O-acetyltransferase NeuD family)